VSIGVVPVIYDHATKKILRWYLLDFNYQLTDSAFGPQKISERVLRVPFQIYRIIAGGDATRPLLYKLQDYVNATAP
jgi:hypothetical protein